MTCCELIKMLDRLNVRKEGQYIISSCWVVLRCVELSSLVRQGMQE